MLYEIGEDNVTRKTKIRLAVWSVVALCAIGLTYQLAFRALARRAEENPNYAVSENAVAAFIGLLEEGRLPGVSIDELEGSISESGFVVSKRDIRFPEGRTMHFRKRSEPDTDYYYMISKANEKSPWVLARAWKVRSGKSTPIWPEQPD